MKRMISLILALLASCCLMTSCVRELYEELFGADSDTREQSGESEELGETEAPEEFTLLWEDGYGDPRIKVADVPFGMINNSRINERGSTIYSHTSLGDDKLRPLYDRGTCGKMVGDIAVCLFFMDDDDSEWGEFSVQYYTNTVVIPALSFILDEAERWGAELNITVWRFSSALSGGDFTYEGTVNRDLYEGDSTKDMMDQAAKRLGYSNNMALRWAIMQECGCSVAPIFMVNDNGRSYTRNIYAGKESDYAEQAVMFMRELNDGGARTPDSFAYILLQLYGAENLFNPSTREDLAHIYFPKDLMLDEGYPIDQCCIGAFTAYTLGWTDDVPKVCLMPGWERVRE